MKRIVLDIETVPLSPESCEDDAARKKHSLDALLARVVCIGVLLVEEFTLLSSRAIVNDDEAELLREFWASMAAANTSRFVVHNGLSFDLPFLWRRSVVNKIKPTTDFDLRKYRTDPIFDTMCVWGNWENRSMTSLDSLSGAFGYGHKSSDGGEVLKLWQERRICELTEYCLRDCWLTYACWCRMNFVEPNNYRPELLRKHHDKNLMPISTCT